VLTASEVAEVVAFIHGPDNVAWEAETRARWARERGEPSSIERYRAGLKEKLAARRNAASSKRHADKLSRTPAWADQKAIKAIYAKARALTKTTGPAAPRRP
jgi:hypothetical protein